MITIPRVASLLPYAAFLLTALMFFPSSGYDDSHITYWAAYTLAEHGQILNYNGEHLEQSSSLLHTILLAALYKLSGWSLPTIGGLFSIASATIAILLIGRLADKTATNKLAAKWLLATASAFVYWSTGGLEATMVSALTLFFLIAYFGFVKQCSTQSTIFITIAVFLYLVARPESIFVLLAFLAAIIMFRLMRGNNIKPDIILAMVSVTLFVLITTWRWNYFGSIFPQPVVAKIGDTTLLEKMLKGVDYICRSAREYPLLYLVPFVFIGFVSTLKKNTQHVQAAITTGSFLAAYTAFVIFAGGDWMKGGRLLVPAMPTLILLVLLVFHCALKRNNLVILLVALNITCTALFARNWSTSDSLFSANTTWPEQPGGIHYSFFEYKNRVHTRDIYFVNNVTPVIDSYINAMPDKNFRIMSGQAGMVPFYLFRPFYGKLQFIDGHGLASKDFTDCSVASRWGRRSTGIDFRYEKFIKNLDALGTECNITPPEFIFDLDNPIMTNSRFLSENGYVIIYMQGGELCGGEPFPGGKIRLGQFFAVRQDIYDAHPLPKTTFTL